MKVSFSRLNFPNYNVHYANGVILLASLELKFTIIKQKDVPLVTMPRTATNASYTHRRQPSSVLQ